jgi:hypothetical protein
MLRTTNTFSKKSCLETTDNYSAPQTLNMIERLSVEPIQQKQGLKENCSTSVRDKNLGTQ